MAVASLLILPVAPAAVHAEHGSASARQAAAEIQAARDRADAAAQALFDKESEIDQLDVAIAAAEVELAEIEGVAEEMQQGLEYQAVRRFVGAGPANFPLLIDLEDANNSLSADVYSSVASDTANVDLDDYDATINEIEEQRDSLNSRRRDAEDAVETYEVLRTTAESEVARLGELEAQRLQDEAVQHELEAQQRAARERIEREAAEQAAQAAEVAAVPISSATSASSETAAPPAQSTDPTPAPESEPQPEPQPEAEPAATPVPPTPPPSDAGTNLACPIAGPRSFADTWGAPRSGGRSHEGVDMMSPSGTPLVAMEAGRVEFTTNTLGGNTVRLYGASGTRYYYAHLSSWEGSSRPVAKGEVIGYVGKTGNTSANHLHLQVHPGGGRAVNPYPYARRACG